MLTLPFTVTSTLPKRLMARMPSDKSETVETFAALTVEEPLTADAKIAGLPPAPGEAGGPVVTVPLALILTLLKLPAEIATELVDTCTLAARIVTVPMEELFAVIPGPVVRTVPLMSIVILPPRVQPGPSGPQSKLPLLAFMPAEEGPVVVTLRPTTLMSRSLWSTSAGAAKPLVLRVSKRKSIGSLLVMIICACAGSGVSSTNKAAAPPRAVARRSARLQVPDELAAFAKFGIVPGPAFMKEFLREKCSSNR